MEDGKFKVERHKWQPRNNSLWRLGSSPAKADNLKGTSGYLYLLRIY